jgi:hypothetical protein
MKPIDEMNEDELWEEFSNQLILDSAAPMSMNYEDSESIRKNGIRQCVNRWRYRFQNNHCNDAISRAYAIELLEGRFLELQKIKKIPGNEKQEDVQLGINWCINTIREMDGVVATTPVAVVKINKSDMQDMVDKKFNEFIESYDPKIKLKGKWIKECDDYGLETGWHCSNCYDKTGFVTTCAWSYCPACGAEMDFEK